MIKSAIWEVPRRAVPTIFGSPNRFGFPNQWLAKVSERFKSSILNRISSSESYFLESFFLLDYFAAIISTVEVSKFPFTSESDTRPLKLHQQQQKIQKNKIKPSLMLEVF